MSGERFADWCQKYKRNGGMQGLVTEFQALRAEGLSGTTNAYKDNPKLNRYANVPCLDDSRVLLNDNLKPQYIHANYVDGYKRRNEFVVTQAPPNDAINDYWRLVWQERVRVVVCLTSLKERGAQKADCFFPPSTKRPFRAGPLRVTSRGVATVSGFDRVAVSRLKLTCWYGKPGSNSRTVIFIYYGDWPDTAVPRDTKRFLCFVKLIRKIERWTVRRYVGRDQPPPPIVVHCSAGVGRSATLIACRIAVDSLEDTDKVDIREVVRKMRKQRAGAIQNYLQYCFVHLTAAEAARQLRKKRPAT